MAQVPASSQTLVYSSPAQLLEVYRVQEPSGTLRCLRQQRFHALEDCQREQQRFLLQQSLSHPHTCQVYRVGSEAKAGEWVLRVDLEWCGEDLDHLTRTKYRQGWEAERCVQLLREVAGALAYAQEKGVCHRDIKPSNLFLTDAAGFKVGDFGCAKSLDSALEHSMAGTPLYLSPILRRAFTQQLLGQQIGPVEHNPYKSDVFSLGLTLVFLLKPSAVSILGNPAELTTTLSNLQISPDFQATLRLMLESEEANRPDFLELLSKLAPSQVSAPAEDLPPVPDSPAVKKRKWRIVKKDPADTSQSMPPSEERLCMACSRTFVLELTEPWRLDLIGSSDSEASKQYCSQPCFRSKSTASPAPSTHSQPEEKVVRVEVHPGLVAAVRVYSQFLHCFEHFAELPNMNSTDSPTPTILMMCPCCDRGVWTRESLPNVHVELVRNSLYKSLVFWVKRRDGEETYRRISAKAVPVLQAGVCHFCTVIVDARNWLGFTHNGTLALVCSVDCLLGAQENEQCPTCQEPLLAELTFFPLSGHMLVLPQAQEGYQEKCLLCYLETSSYTLRCGHQLCKSCLSYIPRRESADFGCLYCGRILRKSEHRPLFELLDSPS